MKVDIVEHLEDGTQRRIATFHWRDGELNCDNPVLWKHLMNSGGGVIIGARGKRYYPRDGVEYLRNLKFQFAGPYLHAQPLDEAVDLEIPTVPRVGSGGTLTGSWSAPVPPAPVLERTEEPAPVARAVTGRSATPIVRPSTPAASRARELRKGQNVKEVREVREGRDAREFRKARETEGELSREVLERICGGVFRLSSALRGIAIGLARDEADQLLKLLTELMQTDLEALKRAYESREEYLEMRYQPPSRVNYLRMWERLHRSWQTFLDVLEAVYAQASESLKRSVGFFQQASLGQAEGEVRQALRIDPGSAEARLLLGDLLRRLDRVPEALAELQQGVELDLIGRRATQTGSERTAAHLRMARARMCIGRTLLGLGRVREAVDQFEKALEHLEDLTRKTLPEALEELERAQLREELSTLHRLLEPIYRALGETERADHHRKRILAL